MYPGERFNAYTHLAGLLGALAGTGVLLELARRTGDRSDVIGVAVFGASASLLYAASLLCHSTRAPAKALWAKADHAAIYLMIAGSYTPFALAGQRGAAGHALLALIWLAALIGAVREFTAARHPALWLYLLLGWLCVAGAVWLVPQLGLLVGAWLLAGAGCYTAGTLFYVNRRGWAHAHGVWHLFVMAGTACHAGALAWVLILPRQHAA